MTAQLLEIRLPSEQTEGTRSQVLRWMKAVGDAVEKNEPLLEIETDKVTVELPAPASGVLDSILKQEQEEISPGELLGRLRVGSSADTKAPAGASSTPAAATTATAATAQPGERLSPAVRRLLAENQVDASVIEGTGRDGRITLEDVQRHLSAAATVPAVATKPEVGAKPAAGTRLVPHTPMRRRIADHMVESLLRTAPHVTTVFEANLARVLADRAAQREAFEQGGVNLTLTAYFIAAIADAVRAVPEANGRWTPAGIEIHQSVHVGVATALGAEGLIVPVLRDAHTRDLFSIARALDELVRKAREQKLSPQDLQGGTITISNHGVSGSLIATPIVINQPQSSIVGIGKLEKRAVVVEENGEERVVVQPRCYVTLTIDHRVMDGFQANRFLQAFVERLERWS